MYFLTILFIIEYIINTHIIVYRRFIHTQWTNRHVILHAIVANDEMTTYRIPGRKVDQLTDYTFVLEITQMIKIYNIGWLHLALVYVFSTSHIVHVQRCRLTM